MGYLHNTHVQAFLRTVRQQCRKCNVRFTLSPGYEVNGEDAPFAPNPGP